MSDALWVVVQTTKGPKPFFRDYHGNDWEIRQFVSLPLLRLAEAALLNLLGERALLRRVLTEYLAGNRIVNGHWYAPDENGEPHYLNQPATPDELALIETLRTEAGL